jgi:hypothetical protein
MPSFATVVLIAAIAAVTWLCWALRQQVRRGGMIVIPMVSFTWLAIVMIVAILLSGFSPLHLLWLLPLSVLLGLWLIMFPLGLHLTMNFLALLAGPIPEPPPTKRSSPHAKKTPRRRPQKRAKKR